MRFFIGLPAMQLLSATRKRVVRKAFLREEGGTLLNKYMILGVLWQCVGRSLRNIKQVQTQMLRTLPQSPTLKIYFLTASATAPSAGSL